MLIICIHVEEEARGQDAPIVQESNEQPITTKINFIFANKNLSNENLPRNAQMKPRKKNIKNSNRPLKHNKGQNQAQNK